MSTVQEIEDAIEALPQEEFFKIAGWMSERFSTTWDRQIEDDIRTGRLDDFATEALAEFDTGLTRPFPEHAKCKKKCGEAALRASLRPLRSWREIEK